MTTPDTRAQGHADAVKWLRKKGEDYAQDFGVVDPDTGAVEFRIYAQEEACSQFFELADQMEVELTHLGVLNGL